MALLGLERFDEALAAADESARLDPESHLGHVARADALEALERHEDAIAAVRVSRRLAPDEPSLMRRLGLLVAREDQGEAEQLWRDALRHEPNHAWTLHALGILLRGQRRTQAALLAFQSAVLLAPEDQTYKRSLHETAGGLLGKLSWGTLGLVLLISITITGALAAAVGDALDGPFLYAMISLVVLIGGANVYFRYDAEKHRGRLAETEPQLVKLYDLLEEDRREGRL